MYPYGCIFILSFRTRVSQSGWTPLQFASANNFAECVRVLLEAGANPDVTDSVRPFSSLHKVICFELICLIMAIVFSGFNSRIFHTQDGCTALIRAADGGQIDCVRLLVKSGANKDILSRVRFRSIF